MGVLDLLIGSNASAYDEQVKADAELRKQGNKTLFDMMTNQMQEKRLRGAMGDKPQPGQYLLPPDQAGPQIFPQEGTGIFTGYEPEDAASLEAQALMANINDKAFAPAFTNTMQIPWNREKLTAEQAGLTNRNDADNARMLEIKQLEETGQTARMKKKIGETVDFVTGSGANTQKVTLQVAGYDDEGLPTYKELGRGDAFSPGGGGGFGVGGLDADMIDAAARKIIRGEAAATDYGTRGAVQLALTRRIEELSPGFNIQNSNANSKYQRLSTNLSGIGLSTSVIPLFEKLRVAGKALNNRKLPLYNKLANATKEQLGNPEIVAFNNLRDDLVAEAERVLMGTGVLSDSKYNRALHNMNSALNYEQLDAALNNMEEVINANLGARKAKPFETVKPIGKVVEALPPGFVMRPDGTAFNQVTGQVARRK